MFCRFGSELKVYLLRNSLVERGVRLSPLISAGSASRYSFDLILCASATPEEHQYQSGTLRQLQNFALVEETNCVFLDHSWKV